MVKFKFTNQFRSSSHYLKKTQFTNSLIATVLSVFLLLVQLSSYLLLSVLLLFVHFKNNSACSIYDVFGWHRCLLGWILTYYFSNFCAWLLCLRCFKKLLCMFVRFMIIFMPYITDWRLKLTRLYTILGF